MTSMDDEEYEKKLQKLRLHVPFLKNMIDKLRMQSRTQQVSKLESLWSMITSNKRLKYETLQKCEDVMLKIQSKSLNGPNKSGLEHDVIESHCGRLHMSDDNMSNANTTSNDRSSVDVIMNVVKLNIARARLQKEVVVASPTPKSPTPDRDTLQYVPITIPMDKIDEIASPDSDNDPVTYWNEANENRYDAERPDVYTNAVMHKTSDESKFEPPTPIIPPAMDINIPPISMQDLQQLEDSISIEKYEADNEKKEVRIEQQILKRPSKVSLVPAPIIKPKPKKEKEESKFNCFEKSKKDVKCDDSKKSKEKGETKKFKENDTTKLESSSSKSSKSASVGDRKSSEASSNRSSKLSSKPCSSGKSHLTEKSPIDSKPSSTSSKHHSSKHSSCNKDSRNLKSHPKSPRSEASAEDSKTIFGSLLSSIDNSLLSEKDSLPKKKIITAKVVTVDSSGNKNKINFSKPIDLNILPSTAVINKATAAKNDDNDKASFLDHVIYRRLADKYNPRPKKKDPETEGVQPLFPKVVNVSVVQNIPVLDRSNIVRSQTPLPFQHNPQEMPFLQSIPHRYSPPPDIQNIHISHFTSGPQNPQQRRAFNPYLSNINDEQSQSPMEYDLSKMSPADFYSNRSPPFNNTRPEPLMNRNVQTPHNEGWNPSRPTAEGWNSNRNTADRISGQFPTWNTNNREGHEFQGRRVQPESQQQARFDPRLSRAINSGSRPEDGNVNRFKRNEDVDHRLRCEDPRKEENNVNRFSDNNRLNRTEDTNHLSRAEDTNISRLNRSDDSNLDRINDKNSFGNKSRSRENERFPRPVEANKRTIDPRINRSADSINSKKEQHKKWEPTNPSATRLDDTYDIRNKDKEEFVSPLDSIYDKTTTVTGKGYGFQKFRIPKKARPVPPPPPQIVSRHSPTPPPRKQSLSPPLRRPPTPPRKKSSESPPREQPLPNENDELVAKLPESIRKDDRLSDVVTVLSSLLKDESALHKIKKLLNSESKKSSSDDSDEDKRTRRKITKKKKLTKKITTTKLAQKKSTTNISVDSTSTDTDAPVRRSGRIRKRSTIFDEDSDEADKQEDFVSKEDVFKPTTADEPEIDEMGNTSPICPFDDFLTDNLEEALNQPAEKLEEEIDKQLANDIFDSLKNDDFGRDIPAEDTQKIIDSWGLLDTSSNDTTRIADSENIQESGEDSCKTATATDLFDKDVPDDDNSQDNCQDDVRNEIDELIKNMPLNDSEKVTDCDSECVKTLAASIDTDTYKELPNENVDKVPTPIETTSKDSPDYNIDMTSTSNAEATICNELITAEIVDTVSDTIEEFSEKDSIKSVTCKNIESHIEEASMSYNKTDEMKQTSTPPILEINTEVKASIPSILVTEPSESTEKEINAETEDKNKILSLRSSPRVKPVISYVEEVKPRAKRTSPKKLDLDKKMEETVVDQVERSKETNDIEKPTLSKEILNLDIVITELIAKYSTGDEITKDVTNVKKESIAVVDSLDSAIDSVATGKPSTLEPEKTVVVKKRGKPGPKPKPKPPLEITEETTTGTENESDYSFKPTDDTDNTVTTAEDTDNLSLARLRGTNASKGIVKKRMNKTRKKSKLSFKKNAKLLKRFNQPKFTSDSTTSASGSTTDLLENEQFPKKPLRPRKKIIRYRKSELDKLHDDIKETMGDKVLISKRTCTLNSARDSSVTDETLKDSENDTDTLEDEINSNKTSKVSQSPSPRQKAKGLKVVVDQLAIDNIFAVPKAASVKARKQQKESNTEPSEKEANESDSDEAEGDHVSTETDALTKPVGRKRRKRNATWAAGVIPSNKKKKTMKATENEETTEDDNNDGNESDYGEDMDADYEVEFVEPDSEHYLTPNEPIKCRLCSFEGKDLVNHYVNNHRAGEVPVSRMSPANSILALQDAEKNNYYTDVVSTNIMDGGQKKKARFTFKCRFCLVDFALHSNVQFVDHISSHTGEYRHKCAYCELRNPSARFIRTHCTDTHPEEILQNAVVILIPPPDNFHTVFGYMCSECHFIQLSDKAVKEHIQIYHLSDSATTIKVNMSLPQVDKVIEPVKNSTIQVNMLTPGDEVIEPVTDAGVFTCEKELVEDEQVVEANRLQRMDEIHKQISAPARNNSSVASLIKSRLDLQPESPPRSQVAAHLETPPHPTLTKAAESPPDVKPNITDLERSKLTTPASMKGTIVIYAGPIKALVCTLDRTADFICTVSTCVFSTSDRGKMADHCKMAHENQAKRVKCGTCEFSGEAVQMLEVFEHLCGKHVDALLVKQEPNDNKHMDKEENMVEQGDTEKENIESSAVEKEVVTMPGYVGHRYDIKITSVTSLARVTEENTSNSTESTPSAVTESVPSSLPPLLPLSGQSPSIIQKLSKLQRKQGTKTPPNFRDIPEATALITSTPNHTSSSDDVASSTIVSTLLDSEYDEGNAQEVLASLSKVSTMEAPSAVAVNNAASKRKFQTGNTTNLYRCPEPKCLYAGEKKTSFEKHLVDYHEDLERVFRCVYCYIMVPLAYYATHLVYYHGTSTFGCSRCCYRAIAPYYVKLHQKMYHPYDQTEVILVPAPMDIPVEQVNKNMLQYNTNRLKSVLKPFSCMCGLRFIVASNYSSHVERVHSKDIISNGGMECKDCTAKKEKNMLAHYSTIHSVRLYQCPYCPFGADMNATDVFKHHSTRHPGLPVDVVVRAINPTQSTHGITRQVAIAQEDSSIYGKLVRLLNPEREADEKLAVKLGSEAAALQQRKQPLLAPKPNPKPAAVPPPLPAPFPPTSSPASPLPPSTTTIISSPTPTFITIDDDDDSFLIVTPIATPPATNLTSNTHEQPKPIRNSTTSNIEPTKVIKNNTSNRKAVKTDVTNDHLVITELTTSNTRNLHVANRTNTMPPYTPTPIETPASIVTTSVTNDSSRPVPSATNDSSRDTNDSLRCVTPTNQRIPTPNPSSTFTPPDEEIIIVVPSSEPNSVPLAGSDLFVCAQCGMHFATSGTLRGHLVECVRLTYPKDVNVKAYQCPHCPQRTKTISTLLDHIRVHGFPRYKCGLCEFKHTQPINVRNHMRMEHSIPTCYSFPVHPRKLDEDFDDFIFRPRQSQLAPQTPILDTSSTSSPNSSQSSSISSSELAGAGKQTAAATRNSESAANVVVQGQDKDKTTFLPSEVHLLPMRAVYSTELKCAVCMYASKVRTNMIRHFKLHADGIDLPLATVAPVNPVPCLERDELMFDKMTNLAYNSHETEGAAGGVNKDKDNSAAVWSAGSRPSGGGRMSGMLMGRMGGSRVETGSAGETAKDDTNYPKFVPYNKRFVCGVIDCDYLCLSDAMLRSHVRALHTHTGVVHQCRHCPAPSRYAAEAPVPAMLNMEAVLRHLRLHGTSLYKCVHCPFQNALRAQMERHVAERHSDKAHSTSVITIRDLPPEKDDDDYIETVQAVNSITDITAPPLSTSSSTSSTSSVVTGTSLQPPPPPHVQINTNTSVAMSAKNLKPWRCAMCKVRCATVVEMVAHTSSKHKIDTMYKCGYCDFSGDSAEPYHGHFATQHADQVPYMITVYFHDPVKLTTPSDTDTNTTNTTNSDSETFDTTPLWRRAATGDVRHIRGILLETRGKRGSGPVGQLQQSAVSGKRDRSSVEDREWEEESAGGGAVSPNKKSPPSKHTKRHKPTVSKTTPLPLALAASATAMSAPPEVQRHRDSLNGLCLNDVQSLSIRHLLQGLQGKYGPYGIPEMDGYKCPLCVGGAGASQGFVTKGERQFVTHVFKDMDYTRYGCQRCLTRSTYNRSVYLRCPAVAASNPPTHNIQCQISTYLDIGREQWAHMVIAIQARIAGYLTRHGLWEKSDEDRKQFAKEEGEGLHTNTAQGVQQMSHSNAIFPALHPRRVSVNLAVKPTLSVKHKANTAKPLSKAALRTYRNTMKGAKKTKSSIEKDYIVPAKMPKVVSVTGSTSRGSSSRRVGVELVDVAMTTAGGEVDEEEVQFVGGGGREEVDSNDDDDVEIIDPLSADMEVFEVDDEDENVDMEEIPEKAAVSPPSPPLPPPEDVTVSSFLPSTTDADDNAEEDTPYSDDDSIGLEIAIDDLLDDEIANDNDDENLICEPLDVKPIFIDNLTVAPSTSTQSSCSSDANPTTTKTSSVTCSPAKSPSKTAAVVAHVGWHSDDDDQVTSTTMEEQHGDKLAATEGDSINNLPEEVLRPHKCPHCEYRALHSSSMRMHIMRHWVEKPFLCRYTADQYSAPCTYGQYSRSAVVKHWHDAHPDVAHLTPIIERVRIETPTIKPDIIPLRKPRGRAPGGGKEEYSWRLECPVCDYMCMNKIQIIMSHLTRHVRIMRCGVCQQEDPSKKQLESACLARHPHTPCEPISEMNTAQQFELKKQIRRVRVERTPATPYEATTQQQLQRKRQHGTNQEVEQEEGEGESLEPMDEFLEIVKTTRVNAQRKPAAAKPTSNTSTSRTATSTRPLTTFDVATSTYIPLVPQQQPTVVEQQLLDKQRTLLRAASLPASAPASAQPPPVEIKTLYRAADSELEEVTSDQPQKQPKPQMIILNSLFAPPRSMNSIDGDTFLIRKPRNPAAPTSSVTHISPSILYKDVLQ